ncbi:hypothetical protein, partial [Bradyrhizobium liaoningense]|uniref:hypothetical protein n=1 Tax=Bradyrhizobium liaoningense TaxID=43992 RepID=UPI001BA9F9D2
TESKSFRTLKATPPDQAASPKISHSSSQLGEVHRFGTAIHHCGPRAFGFCQSRHPWAGSSTLAIRLFNDSTAFRNFSGTAMVVGQFVATPVRQALPLGRYKS